MGLQEQRSTDKQMNPGSQRGEGVDQLQHWEGYRSKIKSKHCNIINFNEV